MQSTEAMINDLEFSQSFKDKFCSEHGNQISYICLHMDCLKNWQKAHFCQTCFYEHNSIHYNFQEYLEYHDADPKVFESKINLTLESKKLKVLPEILQVINDLYQDCEKYFMKQLWESHTKIISKILNEWKSEDIEGKLLEMKNVMKKQEEKLMNISNSNNTDIVKFCLSIKEYSNNHCDLVNKMDEKFEKLSNIGQVMKNEFIVLKENLNVLIENLNLNSCQKQKTLLLNSNFLKEGILIRSIMKSLFVFRKWCP